MVGRKESHIPRFYTALSKKPTQLQCGSARKAQLYNFQKTCQIFTSMLLPAQYCTIQHNTAQYGPILLPAQPLQVPPDLRGLPLRLRLRLRLPLRLPRWGRRLLQFGSVQRHLQFGSVQRQLRRLHRQDPCLSLLPLLWQQQQPCPHSIR